MLRLVYVRGGRQAVQAVLHEPQQGVGDLAVEHPVPFGVDLDVPHVQRGADGLLVLGHQLRLRRELDLDRVPFVLGGDRGIRLGGGGAHPDGVVEVLSEAHQRGDQTTRAALGGDAAASSTEGGRAAMGQQNDRQHVLYLARCARLQRTAAPSSRPCQGSRSRAAFAL